MSTFLLWTVQKSPRARARAPRRARPRARAREEFCIDRNRNVAMLAWKLKGTLNGDPLGFQVNTVSGVCFCAGRHTLLRARARPRVGNPVLPTIGKSPCWLGNQSEPFTAPDRIPKLTYVLVHVCFCAGRCRPLRARPRRERARASTLVGASCASQIG